MSVSQSAMNSPRNLSSARPAATWSTPVVPVDLEILSNLQRSQGPMARLAAPSPYVDPTYGQMSQNQLAELQTQPNVLSNFYFQNYSMQPAFNYGPTAPAPYGGRPGRSQNPFENYKVTPQLLEDFKKTSRGANKKWHLKVCGPWL
jgi:hypothetical protein